NRSAHLPRPKRDRRDDALPPLFVRLTEDIDVFDRLVVDRRGLDLFRIDVHSTTQDEIRATSRKIDIARLVEMAEVACREKASAEVSVPRLSGITAIDEGLRIFAVPHVERADVMGRKPPASLVKGGDLEMRQRTTDASLALEPFGGVDEGVDAAFSRPPIFSEFGSPPFDHRALDRRGDRCSAMKRKSD